MARMEPSLASRWRNAGLILSHQTDRNNRCLPASSAVGTGVFKLSSYEMQCRYTDLPPKSYLRNPLVTYLISRRDAACRVSAVPCTGRRGKPRVVAEMCVG